MTMNAPDVAATAMTMTMAMNAPTAAASTAMTTTNAPAVAVTATLTTSASTRAATPVEKNLRTRNMCDDNRVLQYRRTIAAAQNVLFANKFERDNLIYPDIVRQSHNRRANPGTTVDNYRFAGF